MVRAAWLVALLVALPTVGAAWKGPGGEEPDTLLDARDGLMHLEADVADAGSRIYFDAFPALPETSWNPNVAATGSAVLLPGPVEYRALLGSWKDCNRDGYVGAAESALQDYASALLPADTPCTPDTMWNNGGFVTEMIMIGMVDPCERADAATRAQCGVDGFAPNERVVYAEGTFVWGDYGRPADPAPPECPLAPLPRGTTSSTGGLLRYVDCQDGRFIANAVNAVDENGNLGLRFEDPEDPRAGDSTLDQAFPVTPFGDGARPGLVENGTGRPAATVWDCDAAPAAEARDPTAPPGERGALSTIVIEDPTPGSALDDGRFPLVIVTTLTGIHGFEDHDGDAATPSRITVALADGGGAYARVRGVAPALDAEGSAWDAAERGLDGATGDCDASTASPLDGAAPAGLVESGEPPVRKGARDRNSFVFTFFDGHRGLRPDVDPYTGSDTPSDGGLIVRRQARGGAGPMWLAQGPSIQDPQLVDRHTLGPQPAVYATFYARLGGGLEHLHDVPGHGGTYGAEACSAGIPGPDANGWVCDPARWWTDAQGPDMMPRYRDGTPLGQSPGAGYHLRDVDCWDGQLVGGVPVQASLAAVSVAGPCDRATATT